jgi:hypothetical protein
MRFPRSMHVETCLLNSMSNVWTSERQVLESTSIATVLRGIGEKRTLSGGEFAAHINGSGAGVALDHAGTLQELDGVLALREDHARSRPSDRDPEKEGQGAKICHGELGTCVRTLATLTAWEEETGMGMVVSTPAVPVVRALDVASDRAGEVASARAPLVASDAAGRVDMALGDWIVGV